MTRTFAITALAILSSLAAPAHAQDHDHMHHMATATEAATPLSEGTIKRVDMAKKRLTIAHGPLKNLNMPGMTMSFGVADPALLAKVKEGDKVRFLAEDRKGDLVITQFEAAR